MDYMSDNGENPMAVVGTADDDNNVKNKTKAKKKYFVTQLVSVSCHKHTVLSTVQTQHQSPTTVAFFSAPHFAKKKKKKQSMWHKKYHVRTD